MIKYVKQVHTGHYNPVYTYETISKKEAIDLLGYGLEGELMLDDIVLKGRGTKAEVSVLLQGKSGIYVGVKWD